MADKDVGKGTNIIKANKEIINDNINEIISLYEESIKKKSQGRINFGPNTRSIFLDSIKRHIDHLFDSFLKDSYKGIVSRDIDTIQKEYYQGKTKMPIKKG